MSKCAICRPAGAQLSNIRIVLISAASAAISVRRARAMKNMGLSQLYLVDQDYPPTKPSGAPAIPPIFWSRPSWSTRWTKPLPTTGLCWAPVRANAVFRGCCTPCAKPAPTPCRGDKTSGGDFVWARRSPASITEELQRCTAHSHILSNPVIFGAKYRRCLVQVVCYGIRMAAHAQAEVPEMPGWADWDIAPATAKNWITTSNI